MTRIRPFRPNYGDGSDGDIVIASDTDWKTLFGKQIIHARTFRVNAGITLTLDADYKPHIVRATESIIIEGTINGDGKGNGAWIGGYQSGRGAGGGGGISSWNWNLGSAGGGGGGFGTPGTTNPGEYRGEGGGLGGQVYDGSLHPLFTGIYLPEMCAGSQGGGTSTGYGGGGIYMYAPYIAPAGGSLITLNGASDNPSGSGGLLVMVGDVLELPLTGVVVRCLGGTGNPPGGVGRVYLCYLRFITPDAASRCDPQATVIDLSKNRMVLG